MMILSALGQVYTKKKAVKGLKAHSASIDYQVCLMARNDLQGWKPPAAISIFSSSRASPGAFANRRRTELTGRAQDNAGRCLLD
jgi:hypothetical protein